MADEAAAIRLLVGLGNPGEKYRDTRHNAGADFIATLARQCGAQFTPDAKAHGLTARVTLAGHDIRLLIPTTFMNHSGRAVAAMGNFYKLPAHSMLIVHDELDLPPGSARFKQGGGHGGHNGLRDIVSALGNSGDFWRLRIGIGHPGDAAKVTPWVLGRPDAADRDRIRKAIDKALAALPTLLAGEVTRAMTDLHSYRAE